MKKPTEEVVNEPNEYLRESDESIHHEEEINNIEEKQKHYTAKTNINGIQNQFIIDTGSPVTIMPFFERLVDQTEVQKTTNLYQDVNKNEVKPGEDTSKHRIRKQQTENGNSDYRKNKYNTTTGNGLDEKIQTNNRKNQEPDFRKVNDSCLKRRPHMRNMEELLNQISVEIIRDQTTQLFL